MRKAAVIFALLFVSAASWAQSTVKDGMARLEKQYGVRFVYDASLNLGTPAGSEEASSLTEALSRLFGTGEIQYELKGNYVILKKARRFTVSGTITDASTGETLIGAGVFYGDKGVVTNNYGFYSLTLPEGKIRLSFSYVGYAPRTEILSLDKDLSLDMALTPDATITAAEVTGWKEAGIGAVGLGAQEIPQAVIQRAPMLFGEADVLKSLQLLPGVQAGYSGSSGINIRGGGPDENLLLLDGIPIYNGEHLLGLFSVFAPESVKKVTLYKSSFPARFGGRTASVVDVRMNDGNAEGLHGGFTVGLLTDKAHLEGPIGGKTTFSLTGRVLHTGLVELIGRPMGLPANYFFYDVHAKVSHKLSPKDILTASFYHGRDRFRQGEGRYNVYRYYDENYAPYDRYVDDLRTYRMDWGNTVVGLRWNHVFNGRLFSNTTLSWTGFRSGMQTGNGDKIRDYEQSSYKESDFRYFSNISDFSLQTNFEYTPSPSHAVKFGAALTRHVFVPDGQTLSEKEMANEVVVRDTVLSHYSGTYMPGLEASAYVEDEIALGSRVTVNPGLHVALFSTMGKTYTSLQPRFSARWDVSDAVALKAGYSQMAQYVHLLPFTRISLPTDVWVPITDKIAPQTADQWSLGLYYTGLPGWDFSAEAYYKDLQNIVERKSDRLAFVGADQWENTIVMGVGRAYGIEWLVEKTTGRLTGWLSYTLSRSERRTPDGTIDNGAWFPFSNDRRHKISLYAAYALNDRIDFCASWQFASGNRMTIPTRHTIVMGENGPQERLYIPSRNNWTAPPSHRLDVSVNFRKKKPRGERVWSIGFYNLYGARNPDYLVALTNNKHRTNDGVDYLDYDQIPEGRIYLNKVTALVFLPSFSYTRSF